MKIIVDAELVAGYFKEDVLGVPTGLTGPVSVILTRLHDQDSLYLDSGGQIENEWRQLVDNDWFDAWLGDLIVNGRVLRVDVKACGALLKYLSVNYGFPHTSRDKWYVRTGKAVCGQDGPAVIVSEDVHFHEPACGADPGRRTLVLSHVEGAMARYLRRKEGIEVRSVCQHSAACA